ncbi:MAG: protein kinase [Candidatus Melainabacteria bacterium]|nr:protein kinase [Candidatus Melainabacteria bacterium]
MNLAVPISVLLVEDHSLLRMGIKLSLSNEQSILIVGEACNGAEAIDKVAALNPDVVIMDLSMPVMDGLQSARILRQLGSHAKIIILSSHQEDSVVLSALSSGARGYVSKDLTDDNQLLNAIRAVQSGEIWLDPRIKNSMLKSSFELKNCDAQQSLDEATQLDIEQKDTVLSLRKVDCDFAPQYLHGLSSKFEYLNLLGRGGMSVVHKVRHRLLDKVFAIKFLSSALSTSDSLCKRFTLEAKITSHLNHPNIVNTHDYGIAPDGQPYLLMDFAEGPTIADVLTANGKVSESHARPIFKQIAEALNHAHSHGIMHRDVKPSNVILTRDEKGELRAKLLDFGLAKMTDYDNQSLTKTGQCAGSPLYMSPEQCRSSQLDERSDIYSFGCLMYEVICGRPPFRGSSAFDTMHMHVHDQPAEPDSELCSAALNQILHSCLQKDPSLRLSSSELVKLL